MQNTQTALALSSEKPAPSVKRKLSEVERKWLDACFAKGKKERFSVVAKITPAIAAEMLKHNIGNRTMTRNQIDLHILRLQNDEWVLTHHGIAFADTGVLNDGQHRLTAIVESGIAAPLQVTFGADRQEFLAIDGGKVRTVSNMLQIVGRTNTAHRAALAGAIVYQFHPSRRSDRQYIYEYAMQMDDTIIEPASAFAHSMVAQGFAPTWCLLAYWWIATRSHKAEKLSDFIKGLPNGEGLTGARLYLRNAILRGDTYPKSSTGRERIVANAAAMILTWNAWCKGNKTVSLRNLSSLPEPV